MAQPLKFLLSGPGLIGRKHAEILLANADTILPVIVAPAHDPNIKFIKDYGARHYTSVEAALASERFDAAIIASPNIFHGDQTLACLNAGLPTLVEKPLADSLGDAARIARASESLGVPVLVGHHRTHSPLLGVAKSFLDSAEFGRLVSVFGSAQFYKPGDYFEAGPWRTKKGGGPILINLIHEIGFLRYLAGEIGSVSATASKSVRSFEVEDTVGIVFTFENGAIGTFLLSDTAASSKSWEMTAGENPVYPNFPDQDCYHFAGDMGSLDFPSMRTRTYLDAPKRTWWGPFREGQLGPEHKDPLVLQIDHFIKVIRGEARPLVSAHDGYRNMLVLTAITRAAEERRTVSVTEIAAEAKVSGA